MTNQQRQRIREAIDQAKRQNIATAHGRELNAIRHIASCDNCGGLIDNTRRFCDQACINEYRQAFR